MPVNPLTGQPDYTAQWIQYYRSIGAMKDAEVLEQQLKATKVRAMKRDVRKFWHAQFFFFFAWLVLFLVLIKKNYFSVLVQGIASSAVTATPAATPAAAPAQDYSAQWAAYYRSIGKIQEAETIEAQARLKQSAQGGQGPGQSGSAAAQYGGYPGAGSGGSAAAAAAAAAAAGYYGAQPGGGQPQGGAPAYGYQGYGGYGQAPSEGQ